MCDRCANDGRAVLLTLFAAAATQNLPPFVQHDGQPLDLDKLVATVDRTAGALILTADRERETTTEEQARVDASVASLDALPGEELFELMLAVGNMRDTLDQVHRIMRHKLARRALNGDEAAQARMSPKHAIAVLAEQALQDLGLSTDTAVTEVREIVVGGDGNSLSQYRH